MNMNMLLCCYVVADIIDFFICFLFSDFFRCKDRLCFSAVFEMNPEAEVLSSYFAKAWISLDSCCMHLNAFNIYIYIAKSVSAVACGT